MIQRNTIANRESKLLNRVPQFDIMDNIRIEIFLQEFLAYSAIYLVRL